MKQITNVRKNSAFAWFLATRPKTLAASAVPVLVGTALAIRNDSFRPIPAVLALLFAIFAQITANFVNDYFDAKNGFDDREERLGPTRAVAAGWISPRSMKIGSILTLGIACLFGLGLIPFGGWEMIYVGVLAAVFCVLYSGGPFPLSALGLGDLLVLIFFGIIAVSFSYFVQAGRFCWDLIPLSLAVGFATDNILVSNNYRDREIDRRTNKKTTISLGGERFGRYFYLANGLLVFGLVEVYFVWSGTFRLWVYFLPFVYLGLHYRAWSLLSRIRQGRELNLVLEASAKNLLIFAFCCGIGLIWG